MLDIQKPALRSHEDWRFSAITPLWLGCRIDLSALGNIRGTKCAIVSYACIVD